MRYTINFDKTINQFVPHYIGGRKIILYLQAIMKPLQDLANTFEEWAKETRIEAAMTSQIFKFEWFLNRRFERYFEDKSQQIHITVGKKLGIPIYNQDANVPASSNMVVYNESENKEGSALHFESENMDSRLCSFTVDTPHINTDMISEYEYLSMLTYQIEKYKISGKTYKIEFYE